MGPAYATARFSEEYLYADFIKVILYGSLAKTGKGYGTDRAISETLADVPHEIIFDAETPTDVHPNTVKFTAYKDGEVLGSKKFYSIGGGEIRCDGESASAARHVYTERNFSEIAELCKSHNMRLSDYVFEREGEDFRSYLLTVWKTIRNQIT